MRQRVTKQLGTICDQLLLKAEKGDLPAIRALFQIAALDKADSKGTGSAAPLANQLAFVRKTMAEIRLRP